MAKEQFTTPTSNSTFPPTLESCDQNPTICTFMKGILLKGVMYDATCTKPLPNPSQITAIVKGWNLPIKINNSDIEKVMCGKCHPINGVKRTV